MSAGGPSLRSLVRARLGRLQHRALAFVDATAGAHLTFHRFGLNLLGDYAADIMQMAGIFFHRVLHIDLGLLETPHLLFDRLFALSEMKQYLERHLAFIHWLLLRHPAITRAAPTRTPTRGSGGSEGSSDSDPDSDLSDSDPDL